MHDEAEYDDRLYRAGEERLLLWRSLGVAADQAIVPAMGPDVVSAWPSRAQYRHIERAAGRALVSDGLSAPFADERGPGFGLEVVLEVAPDTATAETADAWMLATVTAVCDLVTGHGGVLELLGEFGSLSSEIDGAAFPETWRNGKGRVGVLLGVPTPDLPEEFELPEGVVRLVPITILTAAELEHVITKGDAGRVEVTRRLAASPTRHRASLSRPSVI